MELNNNINKRKVVRLRSVTNSFNKKLFKIERCNSNSKLSKLSSISKKTGCFGFEENAGGTKKTFSRKISSNNNLCFSIQNNFNIHSSVDLSMREIKDKPDINNIYANINISIDNPNFSINNIENNNKTSSVYGTNKLKNNITNKESSVDLNHPTFISFKGSNIDSESNNSDRDKKVIASIYADYLANKSNSEILSENVKNESKINAFNEYLEKNKILQYEYKKGCISGFSAYTYQNEENINKNKLSINININKSENNNKKGKLHFINFFSLFCGDDKDENDDLSKFLKNNFKDTLLEDKEIISNTTNALKNSFIKCELNYINNFLKEKKENKNLKIQNCSIIIILNIDDIFYIANVGSIISIISSNLSKKIEYLSKENMSQEEYENRIIKKRKSLYTNLNYNINFSNELNNSKECFKNTINNTNLNENKDILNIININTIYSYNFVRIFPGKKLNDIMIDEKMNSNIINHINKNSSKKLLNRRANSTITSSNNVKINNFIRKNNDDLVKTRRASLGPFFKISPKSKNYNPKKNYRRSCAQNNSNNKAQIIEIISSYPDIISFKYKNGKHDFIFIGNDIIFKKLSNDKICKSVYDTMKKCIKKHRSFELFIGWVIKDIIKKCISVGITKNISCLFICFNSLKKLYLKENIDAIKNVLVPLCLTFTNQNNYGFYDDLLSFNFIDVDKANNYNELIEKHIDKANNSDSQLFDIIEENDIDHKKNQNNNKNIIEENENNINKVKIGKKKCCCLFC